MSSDPHFLVQGSGSLTCTHESAQFTVTAPAVTPDNYGTVRGGFFSHYPNEIKIHISTEDANTTTLTDWYSKSGGTLLGTGDGTQGDWLVFNDSNDNKRFAIQRIVDHNNWADPPSHSLTGGSSPTTIFNATTPSYQLELFFGSLGRAVDNSTELGIRFYKDSAWKALHELQELDGTSYNGQSIADAFWMAMHQHTHLNLNKHTDYELSHTTSDPSQERYTLMYNNAHVHTNGYTDGTGETTATDHTHYVVDESGSDVFYKYSNSSMPDSQHKNSLFPVNGYYITDLVTTLT